MIDVPIHPHADSNLVKRLWIYQAERFPIVKTVLLLAVFSAASISVSAHLGGRAIPAVSTFVSIWLLTIIIFFQMRVCDEWKDLEDDTKYRPERPIPSGLISLRFIVLTALAGAIVSVGLVLNVNPHLILPLALVWLWLGLMTFEFFVPEWLKKKPPIYLVSHMMIMPLIDLFITAAEWMPQAGQPPAGLWLFLTLSFLNGCVLEIGRKVWAAESERPGVETYSALWGLKRAAWIWFAICVLAWLILLGVGYSVNTLWAVAVPGTLTLLVVFFTVKKFVESPTAKHEKAIENTAGLWVFICYCLAGFAPFISGWISS